MRHLASMNSDLQICFCDSKVIEWTAEFIVVYEAIAILWYPYQNNITFFL